MIVHRHAVSGETVEIHVVEREEDLEGFRDFIRSNLRLLGLDSETTGLDIYSDSFKCRLVQFGSLSEAWVVPVELGARYQQDVRLALRGVERFVLHNASYDLQVFEQTLGVAMEELWPKVTDTRILSHLVDPRGKDEGGIGHSLEDLTRHYIDEDIADNVKTLMADLAKAHKTTKANVWKKVPLDDPTYQLYSGMDPILAARLGRTLSGLIPSSSQSLIPYEHKLASICSMMERTGFLLDVKYTQELSDRLKYDESRYNEIALNHGCENVNSTDQVADVLEKSFGVKILGRTPSGKRQVNDDLLSSIAQDNDSDLGVFANSVIEAKKAGKWRKTWVDTFLKTRDSKDRCHASINPLRARTARMSITGIPAQTLPAGDWMIRRCFVADAGQLIASVDYQAQELRVLAALSGDPTMQQAFKNNADLHQMTADASGVDRAVGKMVNFAYVYGSGAKNISDKADISIPLAAKVIKGFEERYPKVKQLSLRLQQEGSKNGYIVTPAGRRLPVDPTRAYASLNFDIQSTARDITASAMIRLHNAGFTPYMRLVLHDEVLFSLPEEKAEWGAGEIGRIMATDFRGVHISTDPEVGKRSWGSLYGSDT